MKITRQTETELEVKDSMLWLAAIFVFVALILAYAALRSGDRRLLYASGSFLLFALLSLQKSTFVFDAGRRMVVAGPALFQDLHRQRWLRCPPRHSHRQHASPSAKGNVSPDIADDARPNSSLRSIRRRQQILRRCAGTDRRLSQSESDAARKRRRHDQYDAGIGELHPLAVATRAQIDAVELLRSHTTLSLTEADQRIAEVEKAMGAGK